MLAPHIDICNSEHKYLTSLRGEEVEEIGRSLQHVFDDSIEEWRPIPEPPLKSWMPAATFKFVGLDQNRRQKVVAIVSHKLDPRAVALNVEKAEEARRALGPLGGVILEPLKVDEVSGLAYAVFPYRRPVKIRKGLIGTVHHSLVGRGLLPWLGLAAERTVRDPTAAEHRDCFIAPLERLADASFMPRGVRDAAVRALRRLDHGAWRPRLSLMHDDLNLYNLLKAPGIATRNRTIIIDWERSSICGYGFYDLVTMTRWMKLGKGRLRLEFDRHRRIMACDPVDVRGYLLATLGFKCVALDEPIPEPLTRDPKSIVNMIGTISRDQRRTVVDVVAALVRCNHLGSLETSLYD